MVSSSSFLSLHGPAICCRRVTAIFLLLLLQTSSGRRPGPTSKDGTAGSAIPEAAGRGRSVSGPETKGQSQPKVEKEGGRRGRKNQAKVYHSQAIKEEGGTNLILSKYRTFEKGTHRREAVFANLLSECLSCQFLVIQKTTAWLASRLYPFNNIKEFPHISDL